MTEPRGTLALTERGLHLPNSVAGVGDGFVIRTPASTLDVPSASPGRNVWPTVTPADFDVAPEDAQNPDLCPDRVRLKRYGEPAVEWTVEALEVDD